MMSQVIRQETMVFLTAVLHGALLALVYDLLRALRRVFAHSLAAVSAEDFLFWIAAGFLTFCLLFQETDGVIRGYVVVGAALGVILYRNLFGHLVLRVVTGILGGIRTAVKMIGKAAGKVRRVVGGVLRKAAGKVRRAVGGILRRAAGKVRRAVGRILGKAAEKVRRMTGKITGKTRRKAKRGARGITGRVSEKMQRKTAGRRQERIPGTAGRKGT